MSSSRDAGALPFDDPLVPPTIVFPLVFERANFTGPIAASRKSAAFNHGHICDCLEEKVEATTQFTLY